ncbi:hypothetical protein DNK06_05090 [Pseudomonas daroniae]|uniref:Uncharacterized protein n=1 Tax=Phytopseudomonas daroniae TaxID=2487519 RepID=A0A4Q9QQI3_9GAMM|nr:hypothetical protein DNK06_05090 [Pseudomonas daroniae]TBU85867.1 hypothetical protein DNK31_00970 [Pseudomonas sp. FRB 228]TBU95030.1 hypothetical protein DNJ99_00970 [Pseudomonas daroniae]
MMSTDGLQSVPYPQQMTNVLMRQMLPQQRCTGAGMIGDTQRARRERQAQRLSLSPFEPLVLKAGNSFAKIMQTNQAGHPARHMHSLNAQRLRCPIERGY